MQFVDLVSNNVKTTFIKTNKFKTISINVVFLGEFSKENATRRSLLARMLPFSLKKYPTKKDINNKLNELYDMGMSVSSYPTYKTNMTSFSVDYVNPEYINTGENLHAEAIAILRELIFNPNIKKGGFDKKLFKEQKNILKQNIINIYNNKNRYAIRQLLNHMGKDEITSVSALGNLDDLELIDEKNLYDTYKDIIEYEKASIIVIGDFDNDVMLENLKLLGDFKNNELNLEVVSNEEKQIEEVKEIVEKQNINQAKLIMGFRTSVNSIDELYPASLVFNAMFGGTFQSDLIRVVREENSLAYTIASQAISDLKLLIVTAGIDSSKYEMTKKLVIDQLNNYKNGELSAANMRLAKESLITELIEIEDNQNAVMSFYFKNHLYGVAEDVVDLIEKIKNVSLDDIKAVAQGINLDTVFLLASEDYDG